jgi:hypothetical protein
MVKENRKKLQCGSGISGPFAEDSQMAGTARTRTPTKTATTENSRARMNSTTEYQCWHCALWGHRRTSSNACLRNKNKTNVRSVEICDESAVGEGAYATGVVWCRVLLRMRLSYDIKYLVLTYVYDA